jgi:hypothetical protein
MVGLVNKKQGLKMKIRSFALIKISLVFMMACSDEQAVVVEKSSQKLSDDNVFKEYENVLDKAKGVEQTIQDAANVHRQEIELQGH